MRSLKERKVSYFLEVESDHMPGQPFLAVLHSGLRKARMVAVFVGAGGLSSYQRLEVNAAVINSVERGLRVIPVLIPGAGDIPQLELFLECFSWIDFRTELDLRSAGASAQLDKLARLCLADTTSAGTSELRRRDLSLAGILQSANQRVIIVGHTLDRFTKDIHVREELLRLVRRQIPITVLQLNPDCAYADAHRPFHEQESLTRAQNQHEHTEQFFGEIYSTIEPEFRGNLDVSYSPYMPRFRTIVADDSVFTYLYMYGSDVSEFPDLRLEPADDANDQTRRKIIYSTLCQIHAPETIPFIRCGQVFPEWRQHHIAKWHDWSPEQRLRYKLTHNFYVNNARVFDGRHGESLEDEVKQHIDQTKGRTLVLGCGSGKEVLYVLKARPGSLVIGIDFSHIAVDLARKRCGDRARIYLCNFYDLTLSESLQGESFDSVVANAAFVHLQTRDDINSLLQTIYRRMNPGGVLFIRCLFKECENRELKEELDQSQPSVGNWDANRWFVYYSRDELVRCCQAAGFSVDDRTTQRIAKAREARVSTVMHKGFRHAEYANVYWSSVLAKKTCDVGTLP